MNFKIKNIYIKEEKLGNLTQSSAFFKSKNCGHMFMLNILSF